MGEKSLHYWRLELIGIDGSYPVFGQFQALQRQEEDAYALMHRQINRLRGKSMARLMKMGVLVEGGGVSELQVAAAKTIHILVGYVPDFPWGTTFVAVGFYKPGEEEVRERLRAMAQAQLVPAVLKV